MSVTWQPVSHCLQTCYHPIISWTRVDNMTLKEMNIDWLILNSKGSVSSLLFILVRFGWTCIACINKHRSCSIFYSINQNQFIFKYFLPSVYLCNWNKLRVDPIKIQLLDTFRGIVYTSHMNCVEMMVNDSIYSSYRDKVGSLLTLYLLINYVSLSF